MGLTPARDLRTRDRRRSRGEKRKEGRPFHAAGRRVATAAALVTSTLATPAAGERSAPPLEWRDDWRRVGATELLAIGALGATALGLELSGRPEGPRWTGPILFDTAARDAVVFRSSDARTDAARASDVLLWTGIAHPVLFDTVIVTWLGRQSPDVAYQMAVINAQSYAMTLALTSLSKQVAARERPFVRECAADSEYSNDCDSSTRFRSFVSGHASLTATGAGLMCAHHTQLRLYGSGVLDTGTCIFAIVGTTATGALRLASNVHYASDVIAGHLLGYASGYLVPTLLYYGSFRWKPYVASDAVALTVVPAVGERELGAAVLGQW